MANVANATNYDSISISHIPNIGYTDGLYWRDDNIAAVRLMKMQGTIELTGPGAGTGAGQIFPTKQDR